MALVALLAAACGGPAPFSDASTDVRPTDAADAAFDAPTDALDASDAADASPYVDDPPPLFADVVTAPPGPEVTALALGDAHSCALLADRTVRCWGANDRGQLGDGTHQARLAPVAVTGLTRVDQLAAGGAFDCALVNGGVRCWGANDQGQLGGGSTGDAAGLVNVVDASGAPLAGVQQIALGEAHGCAVLADHTARCWGADDSGQLGDGGTTASPRAVAVVAPGASTPLADVREVVAGRAHACARLGDASVVCWGANESGQLGSLGGLPLAARLFAGSNGTCALDDGASAQCWGASDVGQLGNGSTTGPLPRPIATTSGTDTLYPIGAIGLGARHGCARVTDGRVLCWGARDRVGVDLEDLAFIDHPAQRTVVRDTTALGVGPQHSCAVVMPGTTVQCWGSNSAGQLGDGTTMDRSSPTLVVW